MPNTARRIPLIAALALCLAALLAASASATDKQRYIVVLKDTVERPGELAREQAGRFGGEVGYVYRHALKGYSVKLPAPAVAALERDPRVRFVSRDHRMGIAAQQSPTGIRRTYAASSPYLDIDGQDDLRVNADVAIIDTGIDYDHPDLNVVWRTDCMGGISVGCKDNAGDDGDGHGTHVAGTVGAIDNGFGVVGVAPGVRLLAVKVLSDQGFSFESSTVAGVDWVTARAGQIEVANMSIRCDDIPERCSPSALAVAISGSVDAGVVYAVAAGNFDSDAMSQSPANHPDVITVSALADFDGLPGGAGSPTCLSDQDDTLAFFSNWGAAVEVAAPGVCILSTWKNGGYETISGTSMASPHVAGAAAFLASRANPSTRADVMAIRQRIIDDGNFDWTDDSGDGIKEPLLDVRWDFDPDSDVDDDGRSELVTVASDGRAYTASTGTNLGLDLALLDGRGSYVVDVADVDGDGRADLVRWGHNGGVSVHPGQSNKTFASPVSSLQGANPRLDWGGYSFGGYEPVAVADVNGDGRGDLVAHVGSQLATALGQANGTFGAFSTSASANSALFDAVGDYFVDAGDVTGDGRADVVAMSTSGSLKVYAGQADGSFAAPVTAAFSLDPVMDDGQGVEPVGVADANGDGRADLVVFASGSLWTSEGRADGTFGWPEAGFSGLDSSLLDGAGRELVGLLDYNGDGRADVVAIDDQHRVWTYAAQGSPPTFANPTQGYGAGLVRRTFRRDAPTAVPFEIHELATQKPLVRRPGCEASGCRWWSAPADSDVTGDGRAELVTIDSYDAFDQPRTYFGTNSGVRTDHHAVWSNSLNQGSALFDGTGSYVVDVSDVTGDGQADLVSWGDDGGIAVSAGGYEGEFAAPVTSHAGSDPSWDGQAPGAYEPIAVADVDLDGHGDLIAIWEGASGSWLAMAPGRADGTFGILASGSTAADSALFDGAGEYFIDAADVTGEDTVGYSMPDIVSIATSGSVKVYRGQADGSYVGPFTAASVNPVMDDGEGEEPVGLGDVNLDRRADLVTLDGSGALKLYKGKADATFEAPVSAYAGTIDSSLLDGTGRELVGLLDYNRDRRADLVAIDEQGQVWNYRAQPDGTFAAPTSGGGYNWAPTARIHGAVGHEPATEKNIQRRVGCSTSGCTWPPSP